MGFNSVFKGLNMHDDSISSCGLLEDSLVHISMW